MKKVKKYPELVKIKGKLREEGLSYREASAITGISVGRINDIVNGYQQAYANEAIAICDIAKIPYSDIPIFFALYGAKRTENA